MARELDAAAQGMEDASLVRMIEAGCSPEDVEAFTATNRAIYAAWRPGALADIRRMLLENVAERP